MNGRRIRLVTFDAMNTMIRLNEPVDTVYYRFAKKEHINNLRREQIKISWKETYAKFSSEFSCFGAKNNFDDKQANKDTASLNKLWWTNLITTVICQSSDEPANSPKIKNVADKLYAHYCTAQPWILEPSAKSTLAYLKTKGILLGILSNYDTRLRDICRNFEISNYFQTFVLSGEVGVEKPNKEIFKLMQATLKMDSDEVLHVGDDLDKDYFAAKNAGWKSLLLQNDKNILKDSNRNVPQEDIIVTLDELKRKIT